MLGKVEEEVNQMSNGKNAALKVILGPPLVEG